MRRTLTLLLAMLALTLGVAACGGGEEAQPLPETVEGPVPTEETQTETEDGGDGATTGGDEGGETGGGAGGEGDPAAGEQVFASAGCGGCHTLEDAGTTGAVGPNLDEASPSFEEAAEIVANGRGAMPAFSGQLSEEEIQNVAAYVSEAAGS